MKLISVEVNVRMIKISLLKHRVREDSLNFECVYVSSNFSFLNLYTQLMCKRKLVRGYFRLVYTIPTHMNGHHNLTG